MPDLIFKFDELPLVVLNGLTVATCNGEATVTYDGNGFGITDIWVNGWRSMTDAEREMFKRVGFYEKLIPLDPVSPHYAIIKANLEADAGGYVAEQIEADREDHRDANHVSPLRAVSAA